MTETVKQPGTNVRAPGRNGKKHLSKLIKIIVLLVIVIGGGLFWYLRASQPKQSDGLVTATVVRQEVTETISASGEVAAQTGAMVDIGSQISGIIKHLYADVGSKVVAGEIIAELDLPDLDAQVAQAQASLAASRASLNQELAGVNLQEVETQTAIDQAKASLSSAKASLNQAEANAENSAADLKRKEQLFSKGYIAAADVDTAQAQAKVDAAQVVSAQESIKQAQATLASAQAGIAQNRVKQSQVATARANVAQAEATLAYRAAEKDKVYIRTPISGTVTKLTQQEGETLAAGLESPTVIVVADLTRLQVEAYVDETDIGKVQVGQQATVTVDAYPDNPIKGRVTKISAAATLQENVVTYDVTIALEGDISALSLKPEMTTSVDIIVAKKENALVVPVDAVKQSNQGGTTVTVMRQQGRQEATYEVIEIKTGVSDGEYTEITEGLKEGDVVVLSGEVPGMSATKSNRRMPSMFGGGRR